MSGPAPHLGEQFNKVMGTLAMKEPEMCQRASEILIEKASISILSFWPTCRSLRTWHSIQSLRKPCSPIWKHSGRFFVLYFDIAKRQGRCGQDQSNYGRQNDYSKAGKLSQQRHARRCYHHSSLTRFELRHEPRKSSNSIVKLLKDVLEEESWWNVIEGGPMALTAKRSAKGVFQVCKILAKCHCSE